ncbi:MAG: hypothetical protein WD266_06500 [Balneolales bacterium]
MGQQQLLLVILVTILVGIATIVAINVFGTAAESGNRDAVRQDLLHGVTSAQALHAKPLMFDGAEQDFTNVEGTLIERLGLTITQNYGEDGDDWGNENGIYTIDGAVTSDKFSIRGTPSSGGDDIMAIVCRDDNRQWHVVMGESPVDPC